MFLGAISSAISGASFCRRMRLRSAIATARFAAAWPTTYLSSSATICFGVSDSVAVCVASGSKMAISLQFFDHDLLIGIDANLARNRHRFLRDGARAKIRVGRQRLRRGQRVRPARSDSDNPIVGFDEVAV